MTTKDSQSFNSALRGTLPKARELKKTEIDHKLSMNVIKLVQKNVRDLSRIFIQYNMLNVVIIKENNTMYRMDACFNPRGDGSMILVLQAHSGLWQIDIDDYVKDQTTFTLQFGPY